jgi:hypothetical protein
MSTKDANRQGDLSIEDAETFAARIRPAWETDEEEPDAETARPPELAAQRAAAPGTVPRPAETPVAAAPLAPPAGAMSASDTVIDGVPTVSVGTTAPEPPPAPKPAAETPPRPVAPLKPGKTQVGIGTGMDLAPPPAAGRDEGRRAAAVDTPPPSSRRSKRAAAAAREAVRTQASAQDRTASGQSPPVDQPPAGPSRTASGARLRATPEPPPVRVSSASEGASFPDAEDSESVEIPVASTPTGLILKLLAGAVALIAVIFGVRALTSDDEPAATAPTATATASEPSAPPPVAAAAPTAEPTTPAATAAPPPPPEPTAAATATATAAAKPTAQPAAKKPAEKPAAPAPKPAPAPAGGGKKPSGGGIIRETPF